MDNHSNRRPDNNSNKSVHDHVVSLMKDGIRGRIPPSKVAELRRTLQNEHHVDEIQTAFYEIQRETQHRAKKFVRFIEDKFKMKNYPLHTVLKEADKYRIKNKLSDAEYDEFKHQYQSMYSSQGKLRQEEMIPSTNMSLLFGDIYSNDGISVKTDDMQALDDILKIYTATRSLHNQIIIQSMQYVNFPTEVLEAQYDSTRHNISCAANSVLAAMFAYKIQSIDEHFLYSNISYIVKCKYEKTRIEHDTDRMLLKEMINDSNDVVCSDMSPIVDLYKRCRVQTNLWNCILQLRSGKFFECNNNDFFGAIDECKIFRQDAPDLVYTGDEQIVLRRLFAAISYNPTRVSTTPIFGYGVQSNVAGFPVLDNVLSSRPFFTVRIPGKHEKIDDVITIESAITNPHTYFENGVHVPKRQTIIQTRGGILVFFIPRRSIAAIDEEHSMVRKDIRFTQVPSHVLINERINNSPVKTNCVINIADQNYSMRSAVILETPAFVDGQPESSNVIIGNAAIIRDIAPSHLSFHSDHYIYSPVTIPGSVAVGSVATTKFVWEKLENMPERIELINTKATIIIYEEIKSNTY